MRYLILAFDLNATALGHLTSAVQFGFITGTLIFAILTIADRFNPSVVFLVCALLGSLFNMGTIVEYNTFGTLLSFRFFTGFFLAGIYPVGMKIAADYFEKGLGLSLGYLVGALVIGTAFPHLLQGLSFPVYWKDVLRITSGLAAMGGVLMFVFVPAGPFRKPSSKFNPRVFITVFKNPGFRAAAFGYFGHMWELYAFWAFVPVMLSTYNEFIPQANLNVPFLSFIIIGLGGPACLLGGYLSLVFGSKRTAFYALLLSGTCCLVSPAFLSIESPGILVVFLIFWGLVVIADSPLFSTLVAQNTNSEARGTALTITNSIGFAITIISIQLLTILIDLVHSDYLYLVLSIGPVAGLLALKLTK